MIKRSIFQESIAVINICLIKMVSIDEAKTIRIVEEKDNSIISIGDFNTLISILDRTTRQNISKYVEDLDRTFIEHLT